MCTADSALLIEERENAQLRVSRPNPSHAPTPPPSVCNLQAGLRGAGLKGIVAELRAKLWTLRRRALLFWSVAHVACFSVPVYWMMPIADNFLTLVFNVYQSILAHEHIPASL